VNRHKLTIAYDGTAYAGWQIQPNGLAVQEVLQNCLADLDGRRAVVHGSGRTDQGVHARGQVAHVDLKRDWPLPSLKRALNSNLPNDVRVLRVEAVDSTFHARRSAIGKEYRYFIHNAEIMPPHLRLYQAHVRRKLDVGLMREAAGHLVGTHDFAAFSANPRRKQESTVRRLDELGVRKRGASIAIVARGEGFLYKMVRSLAGFLMRVGEGGDPPAGAEEILAARVRTARVPTAPPLGLFLWEVKYGETVRESASPAGAT